MDVTTTHVFCFKFQNSKCVGVEAVSAFNLLQIAIESFTAGQTVVFELFDLEHNFSFSFLFYKKYKVSTDLPFFAIFDFRFKFFNFNVNVLCFFLDFTFSFAIISLLFNCKRIAVHSAHLTTFRPGKLLELSLTTQPTQF